MQVKLFLGWRTGGQQLILGFYIPNTSNKIFESKIRVELGADHLMVALKFLEVDAPFICEALVCAVPIGEQAVKFTLSVIQRLKLGQNVRVLSRVVPLLNVIKAQLVI